MLISKTLKNSSKINNKKENTVIKNANKNRNNPIDKEAYGWYNVIYMTIRMFRR